MNRRGFLKFLGGGLAASATMAEAGALAEFMDWLKRKPVWSFPSEDRLFYLYGNKMADLFFTDTPFQKYLRERGSQGFSGGSAMVEPFQFTGPITPTIKRSFDATITHYADLIG